MPDAALVARLALSAVWLLGMASMILVFTFQLTALRFGPLALVQPVLALELLIVFGYLAVAGSRHVRVRRRDWLAAAAISVGVGGFLALASPSGGRLHAPRGTWLASHALAAGPLAASQPGFTVLDPLSATLLGQFVFAEHLRARPADLTMEALALAVVLTGASVLSHSCLIEDAAGSSSCLPTEAASQETTSATTVDHEVPGTRMR